MTAVREQSIMRCPRCWRPVETWPPGRKNEGLCQRHGYVLAVPGVVRKKSGGASLLALGSGTL